MRSSVLCGKPTGGLYFARRFSSFHITKMANSIKEIELQLDLLHYFDQHGHLSALLSKAAAYLNRLKMDKLLGNVGLPLTFCPEIDLVQLTQLSGELGSVLCCEPHRGERIVHSLVLQIISTELDVQLGPEMLHTPLRLRSALPLVSRDLWMGNKRDFGLVRVRGFLAAITLPVKYLKNCVSRCPVKFCGGYAGRRVRGTWVHGRFKCQHCGAETVEVPAEREESEEVRMLFMSVEFHQKKSHFVTIVLKEDLTRIPMELGQCYEMVCRPLLGPHSTLESCSAPTPCQPLPPILTQHRRSFGSLPPSIDKVWSAAGNSPGALVVHLAASIAVRELPRNILMSIKVATLLSLASLESPKAIPLLVCGAEWVNAARLMLAASRLSPRSVTPGALQGPLDGIVRDAGDKSGVLWLEAGPLLLAAQGVCFLGDWAALKNEARHTVISAIEKGAVTFQLPKHPLKLPLRAAVWMYSDRIALKQLKPLMDVFGLPWLAETSDLEDVALCDRLLDISVHGTSSPDSISDPAWTQIPEKEIQEFLSIVATRPIKMTAEASRLIKDYFVASRRARGGGMGSIDECLPMGAINTLTSMAESHARLSLNEEVRISDAVAVIALYEQTLTALFGPSVAAPPPPCLSSLDSKFSINEQMEQYMESCFNWLQNFLSSIFW